MSTSSPGRLPAPRPERGCPVGVDPSIIRVTEQTNMDESGQSLPDWGPAGAVSIPGFLLAGDQLHHTLDYVIMLHLLRAPAAARSLTPPALWRELQARGIRSANNSGGLVGRNAVYDSLNRLIEAGFVRRVELTNERFPGRKERTVYEVFGDPAWNPDWQARQAGASRSAVAATDPALVLAACVTDPNLSLQAKGVCALLASLAPSGRTDVDAIVAGSRDDAQVTTEALRELKRQGYVELEHTGSPTESRGSRYALSMPQAPATVPAQDGGNSSRRGTDGWAYAICAPGSSSVKIGTSVDPRKRLAGLQTTSASRLDIIWTGEGGAALEHFLHEWFHTRRTRGEWFDFSGENAVELIDKAAAAWSGQ